MSLTCPALCHILITTLGIRTCTCPGVKLCYMLNVNGLMNCNSLCIIRVVINRCLVSRAVVPDPYGMFLMMLTKLILRVIGCQLRIIQKLLQLVEIIAYELITAKLLDDLHDN